MNKFDAILNSSRDIHYLNKIRWIRLSWIYKIIKPIHYRIYLIYLVHEDHILSPHLMDQVKDGCFSKIITNEIDEAEYYMLQSLLQF